MTQAGGDTLDVRFAVQMGQCLGPDFPTDIGLAVSGGGDSMAMLALCHGWARIMGTRLWVVTIDHGLRAESADEADMVAKECAALGHPHTSLRWTWDGRGNLQEAARKARLGLIETWRGPLRHVLFAHTEDDLAETFLIRLARGSGVEGLSAMEAVHMVRSDPVQPVAQMGEAPEPGANQNIRGFRQVRPLLGTTRAELRHYADTLQVRYVDDPSNEDPRFDRVRARRLLADLRALDLTPADLAQTAARLRRARQALWARARDVAAQIVLPSVPASGHVLFDRDAFAQVERDTQLRLLAAALQFVAHAPHRPRAAALERMLDGILSGTGAPLHGGQVRVERDRIRIFREFKAVQDLATPAIQNAVWDDVWHLAGAGRPGTILRALGPDGWRQMTDRPVDAPPYDAALSIPALFEGETLLACPGLSVQSGADPLLQRHPDGFRAFLQLR